MNTNHFNPYADFGSTVTGSRFIGRFNELCTITTRIFGSSGFGSIAIVGLPRIGKTSLISEAIRRATCDMHGQSIAVARLDVGAFDSADGLLRCLIEDLTEGIRAGKIGSELTQKRVNEVLERSAIDFSAVRTVFKSLRQTGIRPVCVLDEFDAGRRVFRDTPRFFHWLRELCSNPEFKAAIVLVAKRRLQDISRLAGYESSYWSNVLMTLPLKHFSDRDVAQFWSELEKGDIFLDETGRQEVLSYMGHHPYLLDVFGYHAWDYKKQGRRIDDNWIKATCGELAQEYHQQVTEILKDGPMLSKVIQVIVGPQWDVTSEDVVALCELGVLRDEEGVLRGFSRAFEDHLRVMERCIDIWPLWRDTERALRDVLERNLERKFGPNWPNALGKARSNLKPILDECRKLRDEERKKFGLHDAEPSLLSYSYPMDLYKIMSADWANLGESLLGKDKRSWALKFNTLAKVRNPLAHNRAESVDDGDRKQAEGICREILNRYHDHAKTDLPA